MSGEDGLVLGELLCARLCHDLAGALGAIGTGVELLVDAEDAAQPSSEALDLLAGSAEVALNRFKFLRLALGGGGGAVAGTELHDLVGNFLKSSAGGSGGLDLGWTDADPATRWEVGPAKLVLNLVMLARDCLPRGGLVSVGLSRPSGHAFQVAASGRSMTLSEAVKALDAPGLHGMGPKGAQGYYTGKLAKRIGWSISYENSNDNLIFVATKS